LFLDNKISFLGIEELIERALNEHEVIRKPDLETIREIDRRTRLTVSQWI
jgi:1-deoxy-D-xylulose-5-phosphate reductoisomerase